MGTDDLSLSCLDPDPKLTALFRTIAPESTGLGFILYQDSLLGLLNLSCHVTGDRSQVGWL